MTTTADRVKADYAKQLIDEALEEARLGYDDLCVQFDRLKDAYRILALENRELKATIAGLRRENGLAGDEADLQSRKTDVP